MFLENLIKESRSNVTQNNNSFLSSFLTGDDIENYNSLNNATYCRCLTVLADTIAMLPLLLKKEDLEGEKDLIEEDLYHILRLRANPNMSAYNAINALILTYKHCGIAGLYIKRDRKGTVEALYPCNIEGITIDDVGLIKSNKRNKILIDYSCGDFMGSCFEDDMIILRDNSLDGINSNPTKKFIKGVLDSSEAANKYQIDLFRAGLTSKVAVQMTSDIREDSQLSKIQDKFEKLYNGSRNRRIFLVPSGFHVSPLNLSLADSQFAELKEINTREIASALKVPQALLKADTLNEEQLVSFLTTTINPILTALEQELNYKLLTESQRKIGYKIRFNINSLLRTNSKTQQEILCQYVKNGIYTVNDARRILGFSSIAGADTLLFPAGQVTLDSMTNKEVSWIEGGEKDAEGN